MKDQKFDLEDRLVDFAVSAAILCIDLPNDFTGAYYGNQLLRSGCSSALNLESYRVQIPIRISFIKLA